MLIILCVEIEDCGSLFFVLPVSGLNMCMFFRYQIVIIFSCFAHLGLNFMFIRNSLVELGCLKSLWLLSYRFVLPM